MRQRPSGFTSKCFSKFGAITSPHWFSGRRRKAIRMTIAATGMSANNQRGRKKCSSNASVSGTTRAPAKDASGQQQAPQCEPQDHGRAERPLIERNARAPCQRFKFYGSKAIDVGIDCLKLSAIFGAEKLSTGYAGDLAQRGKIDPVVAGRVGIAKADCVDD